MTMTTITYAGDLRCEATHQSGYTIRTDAPKDNHGKGESFSPTDLVGTALASCIITTMAIGARQVYGFELGAAAARVEKIMSDDKPRRIVGIIIDLQLALPADHPHRTELEKMITRCPVHHALNPEIVVTVNTEWGAAL